jgi:hypothetical protein
MHLFLFGTIMLDLGLSVRHGVCPLRLKPTLGKKITSKMYVLFYRLIIQFFEQNLETHFEIISRFRYRGQG